jgi:peptidoglycan/xylan/chitin deacetylase (PgdA/CDA1 family)
MKTIDGSPKARVNSAVRKYTGDSKMEPRRTGPFPFTPINRRPKLTWPNGARVAFWLIPNIEVFPLDEPVPGGTGMAPDIINWAPRDYGARIGIYRMMEVMEKYGVRGTVALNSEVCDDYPEIIEDCMALNWEFMGHNHSNSRYLHTLGRDEGRELVLSTFDRIEKATGIRPKGWLSSGLQQNWTTLNDLIEAGATYVADWINDDQPYLMDVDGKSIASIPYSGEINDIPQVLRGGHTSEVFADMAKRQFDTLYREGAESGRVMAMALHPFITGVPHRIAAFDSALEYITSHDDVWLATGSEIIDHYLNSGSTF